MFLGIENVLDEDLAFLRARRRTRGARAAARSATRRCAAIEHPAPARHVRRRRPDRRQSRTTRASRSRPTSRSRGSYVDWPYIQHPTPYPRHADDAGLPRARPDRQRARRGVRRHDRRRAHASTSTADEIEFMRWRAERWMKVRHLPAALAARSAASCCATGRRCSRTPSAAARGGRCSASRASARCSRATRRSGAREREYLPSPERNDHPSMGSGARRVEGAAITSG